MNRERQRCARNDSTRPSNTDGHRSGQEAFYRTGIDPKNSSSPSNQQKKINTFILHGLDYYYYNFYIYLGRIDTLREDALLQSKGTL